MFNSIKLAELDQRGATQKTSKDGELGKATCRQRSKTTVYIRGLAGLPVILPSAIFSCKTQARSTRLIDR